MANGGKKSRVMLSVLINTLRFVLAAVFLFSGFVKAIDPLGTVYKLGDYLESFGLSAIVPHGVLMIATVLLCIFEFTIGICLLFAIRRRAMLTAALVFVVLMTPLTLYLALTNPIADCGCFGDAIHLTNWQTFWKNVVLLAMIIPVFIYNRLLFRLINENVQWIISGFAFVSMLFFMTSNLRHLPLYDFRPYRVGTHLETAMSVPEDAPQPRFETTFVLSKDGEEREFTLDNYPDSTWTFVNSRTVMVDKGYVPPIHDFALIDEEGEDITNTLFEPGWTLLLVMNELTHEEMLDVVNDLYDYAVINDIPFYALTSATTDDIQQWIDHTGASYPFCQLDDITLKTIVRSNPGLVVIHDGVITAKWSRRDLPRENLFNGDTIEEQPWAVQQPSVQQHRRLRILVLMFFPYLFVALLDFLVRRRGKERGNG